MTIHDIAKAEDIPPRFLEANLRDLKQSGLTDSIRGKDGGYRLTLPPHEISIGHVVRAVEGPWFPASESSERDVFTSVWDQADQALTDLLDQKNFQILVAEQDALRGDKVINYSI
jgi:Rrf2 family protein